MQTAFHLTGHVALVTGGNGGIGLEMATSPSGAWVGSAEAMVVAAPVPPAILVVSDHQRLRNA